MKVWITKYWDDEDIVLVLKRKNIGIEEIYLCRQGWIRAGGPVPQNGQVLACDVTIKPWKKRKKK